MDEVTRGPVVVPMDSVKSEPVEWLWPERIAIGKLNILAGDPGVSKSMLTMDIAARTSRCVSWPDRRDEDNPGGGVVLLSAEDDLADTIRPRLDAAGAEVSRIVALKAVRRVDPVDGACDLPFTLDTDLPILEHVLKDTPGVKLVVIDPISAYLGGKIDSHKNSDVRALLAPLAQLASDRRVALLCVTHLNKGVGGSVLHRMTGSLAFVAAARLAWLVTRDKDDARRRLMLNAKSNIGPETDGLAFRIEQTPEGVGYIAWESGSVDVRADDALNVATGQDRSERDEVKGWLQNVLQHGELEAAEIKKMAKREGYSDRTLRRAKDELGVQFRREGFSKNCKTFWGFNGHE